MMYRIYRPQRMWREMSRLQNEMNRMFDNTYSNRLQRAPSYPAMNVWTSEEDAIITAEVPGVNPEDIDISVVGETLTLKGELKPDVLDEGARYHRRERGSGQFARTIQLPFQVDTNQVQATFENGVLQIALPRAEADKPKKIQVVSA